jgi:hypothetical protein
MRKAFSVNISESTSAISLTDAPLVPPTSPAGVTQRRHAHHPGPARMFHELLWPDRASDFGIRNADFGMKTEAKSLMNYYMPSI